MGVNRGQSASYSESYRVENAREFLGRVGRAQKVDDIPIVEMPRALYALAEAGEWDAYRRVVDSYVRLTRLNPPGDPIEEELCADPLSFIEFLCAGFDHSFAALGFGGGIQPVGRAQGFFRDQYGAHYPSLGD